MLAETISVHLNHLTSVARKISYNMYAGSLNFCIFVSLQHAKRISQLYLALRSIRSLHHSSSPTVANVAKLIHSIRHFISPVHPLQPSSRSMRALPRCYCAPISHRSKKPASISSPATIFHSHQFLEARGCTKRYLTYPIACRIVLGQYIYGFACKSCVSPKYVFFNLRSHRSPTILPCLYFHITCPNHLHRL